MDVWYIANISAFWRPFIYKTINNVFDAKPTSLEEMKTVVEEFAQGLSSDDTCVRIEHGVHFEHLIKKYK